MATSLTADVLDSPAVGILCDLDRDGFRVELAADGVLVIAPRSRLTPERMQAIASVKDAIKVLLRCCDDGVVARRDVFRAQLEATPAPGVPAFVLQPDIPTWREDASVAVTGCPSCGSPVAGAVQSPGGSRADCLCRRISPPRSTPPASHREHRSRTRSWLLSRP